MKEPTPSTLRERFIDSLALQNLNMPALAKQIGVTRQTLYNIENGATKPTAIRAVTLLPLARALGVRPEWLLHGTGRQALDASEASADGVLSTLSAVVLHEAETLVLNEELQAQRRFLPMERARQLARAYTQLVASDV